MQELGAPERLYLKVPTTDLLEGTPGQSGEASTGLGYRDIDDHLEGDSVPATVEARYLATEHQRRLPVTKSDGWWR